MDEDHFGHLWKMFDLYYYCFFFSITFQFVRYDKDNNGWVTLNTLLQHLGVGSNDMQPNKSLPGSILSVDDVQMQLLKPLTEFDTLKCGKVRGKS